MQFQDWKRLWGGNLKYLDNQPAPNQHPASWEGLTFLQVESFATGLLLSYCFLCSPRYENTLHCYLHFMGPYRPVISLTSSNEWSCSTQSGPINTYFFVVSVSHHMASLHPLSGTRLWNQRARSLAEPSCTPGCLGIDSGLEGCRWDVRTQV